jgi:hypothetical protein
LDDAQEHHIRESAFFNYWLRRVETQRILSRDDLDLLLRFPQWQYACNEIVQKLCVEGKIAPEDVDWLLTALPSDAFAHQQVQAFALWEDPSVGWEVKLRGALELRADWMARRVLSAVPLELAENARKIIGESKRPKRAKNVLYSLLMEREAERRRLHLKLQR